MANVPTKQAQGQGQGQTQVQAPAQAPVKEADPKAAPQAKQPEPEPEKADPAEAAEAAPQAKQPEPEPEKADPAEAAEAAPQAKAKPSNKFPREFVLVSGKHRLPNGEVLTPGARVTLSEMAYRNLADKFRELNVNE